MEDSDCTTPNRTWRNRVLAVLVVFGVALGMTLASATTANAAPLKAAPITYGAVTNNCGIVTCSIYISRSGTKSMNRFVSSKVGQYGAWGAGTVVCGALGFVPYVGPGLGVYCGFRFAQFTQVLGEAAGKNKCFKVTYTRPVRGATTVTHISTNNGSLCKN